MDALRAFLILAFRLLVTLAKLPRTGDFRASFRKLVRWSVS
jgi:hypothetical protein